MKGNTKTIHLIWIVPLVFFMGMVSYSLLDAQTEKALLPLIETCVGYDTNMDQAILLLQMHCIRDDLTENRNNLFCDEYMNQTKVLSKYNWRN